MILELISIGTLVIAIVCKAITRTKVRDLDGFQGVVKKKKGKNIISQF